MRTIVALLLLVCSAAFAHADTPAFKFGGEAFIKKFEVKGRAPNAQIEFGLAGETLEGWTKLLTLHAFATSGNDANRAVANLASLVRQRYKTSNYKVINNPKTAEAIIDFLIPMPNSDLHEFNVFKYAPAGKELVALQFAYRVDLMEIGVDAMRAFRQRAIQEMAAYDMAPVKAFFGKSQ